MGRGGKTGLRPRARSIRDGLSPEMFTPWGMLALADELPVMVGYFDRDMRYRFLNKALADWLELPRSEILGRTPRELTGEEAFARARAADPTPRWPASGRRSARPSSIRPAGCWRCRPNICRGATRTARCSGFIAVITDVTEQRAAERALRESEARFRRIANSAPVMMWVTRLDRTRDFVNDAYVDFVGGTREEVAALDWRTRHPPRRRRPASSPRASPARRRASRFTLEGRYLRDDGECRWLRSVSQPRFGPDGELIGFIGVATDITLAKEAELELEGPGRGAHRRAGARARRGSGRSSRRCSRSWSCSTPTARSWS